MKRISVIAVGACFATAALLGTGTAHAQASMFHGPSQAYIFLQKTKKIRAKSLPPTPTPMGRVQVCILH